MANLETGESSSENLFKPSPVPRFCLGILILLAIATVGAWFGGFLDPVADYLNPVLTEATGKVTYNGEPLGKGMVTTQCEIGGLMGALGGIEPDGTFTLYTNGATPGIYAGRHRVMVRLMTSGFPPSSLLPDEYGDGSTTPFRIDAKRGKKNYVELSLKGPPLEKKSPSKKSPDPAEEKSIEPEK